MARPDSIGVKVVNGKAFVLHKVDPGENLNGLSRRYGSSIQTILQVNALESEGLQIGQVLRIPSKSAVTSLSLKDMETSEVVHPTAQPMKMLGQGPVKHKVQKGETLYAISRKYKVSVQQIQSWNDLKGAAINIGQTLIVSDPASGKAETVNRTETVKKTPEVKAPVTPVKQTPTVVETPAPAKAPAQDRVHTVQPGETLYGISRKYGVSVAEIKKINKLTDPNIRVGQELVMVADMAVAPTTPKVEEPPVNPNQSKGLQEMLDEATEEKPEVAVQEDKVLTAEKAPASLPPSAKVIDYKDEYSGQNYKRVEEKGKAGLIEDFSTDQTKFFAFHKYLPVGSYLRVDYPDHSQSILVEVISSLPKDNSHTILLTSKCMDYLRMDKAGGDVVLRYVVPLGN